LDHFTEDDEIEVAVEEGGAGWLRRCLCTNHLECTLEIEPIRFPAQAATEARCMRQQMANGDGLFPTPFELGQVSDNGFFQLQFASFIKHH